MKHTRSSVLAVFLAVVLLITGSATVLTVGAADEGETNLALGKTATASSSYSSDYLPAKAVDGNTALGDSSRWAQGDGAAAAGQWLRVDLGTTCSISRVVVHANNNNQIDAFKVQVSNNDTDWADFSTETVYTGGSYEPFTVTPNTDYTVARYVRLYFVSYTDFATVRELEVYGEETTAEPVLYTNLAKGKEATASSSYNNDYLPAEAVDGNASSDSSMWAASAPWGDSQVGEWLQVDLGENARIDKVVVTGRNGFVNCFEVQVSSDARYWADLSTEILKTDGTMTPVEVLPNTGNTVARYVRLNFVWGTALPCIIELEVYGAATNRAAVTSLPNLAQSGTASAGSQFAVTTVEYPEAAKAIDGSASTRWAADQDGSYEGEYLQVDLGKQYDISAVGATFEGYNFYKFKVQVSDDGQTWTDYAPDALDLSSNAHVTKAFYGAEEASGRYVRVYFRDGSHFPSIWELEVYGQSPVRFSGVSLTLQNDLTVNFKANGALENKYTDLKAIFELNEKTAEVTEYTVKDGKLTFAFENIQPDQMGDTITATLLATSKADGQEYSHTVEYSIKKYADSMLGAQKSALNSLLVDMLNYGTAAQNYTAHNTDVSVNGDLTDTQKDFTAADRTFTSVTDKNYRTVTDPEVTWTNAGLNLERSVIMRFKLACENAEGLSVRVAVGSETAVKATITELRATAGGYYVYFQGLNPAQLSENVYVTAYRGETAVSNTLRYSVESYAYAQQNSQDTYLAELVKALMKYGDGTKAYVGSLVPSVPDAALDQASAVALSVNETETHQTIESFGASGAWWSQDVGGWTNKVEGVEVREQVAKLLFDSTEGIGLNNYRYNIGAGSENDTAISDAWRRAESFSSSEGSYDWTKDANAVWFMEKAVEMGVDELVFFANSPPVYLTKNGKAYGDEASISNWWSNSNLNSGNYTKFSTYVLDIVEHFVTQFNAAGYTGKYFVSPVNEPNGTWTAGNGQEGCHYSSSELVSFLKSFINTKNARESVKDVELSAPELFSWYSGNDSSSYSQAIANDSTLKSQLTSLDLHSYYSTTANKNSFMSWKNSNMPSVSLKSSEWCDLDGEGKDYGMTSAIKLAQVMHEDLTVLDVVSWQYWIAVSKYDWQDGLIYAFPGPQVVGETKRLWAMGNYSRFIKRGYQRVSASSGSSDIAVSAYKGTDDNGQENLVLVLINSASVDHKIAASGFGDWTNGSVYVTDAEHDLEQTQIVSGGDILIPATSVVTVTLTK